MLGLAVDTDSKIEAETSPTRTRIKVNSEVTLWCNASGYPHPVVYWSRQDRRHKLQDGSHQYWVYTMNVQIERVRWTTACEHLGSDRWDAVQFGLAIYVSARASDKVCKTEIDGNLLWYHISLIYA